MLNKWIQKIVRKLGYQKRPTKEDRNASYRLPHAAAIAEDFPKVQHFSMLSYLKLATLYEQVIYLDAQAISGALVECGVWKGGSVGMMALANLRFGKERRKIHLFDAFDDICEPDPKVDGIQAMEDIEQLLGEPAPTYSGQLTPIKGIYDSRGGHGTIAECRSLLVYQIGYDESAIAFHKGWFQNTLPEQVEQIDQIAMLRLDADWYESTKVCLEYLYDKVVPGGFVIIDDYGRYDGCKKAVDEFLEKRNIKTFLHFADYQGGECRYFIKN